MIRELFIEGKGSYTSFGQCISKRNISVPKKKVVKESVPFQNGSYDFSDICGESAWEEREVSYTFDIIGENMEEVEIQKSELLDWVMKIQNQDIFDGYKPGYHLHGSYDSSSWSEDWEQCELTIVFKVYPFYISNTEITKKIKLKAGNNNINIFNNGSHNIVPTIVTESPISISKDNVIFNLGIGTFLDEEFVLNKGTNSLSISNDVPDTFVIFKFVEEVF